MQNVTGKTKVEGGRRMNYHREGLQTALVVVPGRDEQDAEARILDPAERRAARLAAPQLALEARAARVHRARERRGALVARGEVVAHVEEDARLEEERRGAERPRQVGHDRESRGGRGRSMGGRGRGRGRRGSGSGRRRVEPELDDERLE
jgi:hypothetical protein